MIRATAEEKGPRHLAVKADHQLMAHDAVDAQVEGEHGISLDTPLAETRAVRIGLVTAYPVRRTIPDRSDRGAALHPLLMECVLLTTGGRRCSVPFGPVHQLFTMEHDAPLLLSVTICPCTSHYVRSTDPPLS